ncbi:hypothetical protein ACHWQZ_G006127 [Mnemiopsis leidyi]
MKTNKSANRTQRSRERELSSDEVTKAQPSITRILTYLTSPPIPTSLPTKSITAFHNTLPTDRMSPTYLIVTLPHTRSSVRSS